MLLSQLGESDLFTVTYLENDAMNENENGKVSGQSTLAAAVANAEAVRAACLLDMRTELGGIRQFLIGGPSEHGVWPAGRISIALQGGQLRCQLSLPSFELEAVYTANAWSSLLETMNNDLELNTVAWMPDYKGRRREEVALHSR